jgi:hypothetical protein
MNVNITLLTTMICAVRVAAVRAAADGPGLGPEEEKVAMIQRSSDLRTSAVPQSGAEVVAQEIAQASARTLLCGSHVAEAEHVDSLF